MRQGHDALLELFGVLGRRWAMRVLWELRGEPLSYRALLAQCSGMSSSVLTHRLRELSSEGLLVSTPNGYELTAVTRDLLPIMVDLDGWATAWLELRDRS